MANLTQSISESLRLFGEAPSTLWGFTWGSGKWGEGSFAQISSADTAYIETGTFTDAMAIAAGAILSDSLTVACDETSEQLYSGGYLYVFVKPTTDAALRSTVSFTAASPQSTAWTSLTVNSTSWS